MSASSGQGRRDGGHCRNVPAGRYAAQVFHDENRNKKVDQRCSASPRKASAFRTTPGSASGPPKWADAAFDSRARAGDRLKMRYFLGASGPAKAR
jgi:uncharacterized protein (DUF2141 family)